MTQKLNSSFDDDPAQYESLRAGWLFRRRVSEVLAHLRSLRAGDTVLELGCGTGQLISELSRARPDLNFIGVEPIGGYVDYAREIHGSESGVIFVQGFAERLQELEVSTADMILSNDVLHHMADLGEVCRSAAGVSHRWTQWLAIEPNPQNPYVIWYHTRTEGEALFPVRRFTRSASDAGWHLVQRDHLFLVPQAIRTPPRPLVAAERMFERLPVISGGTLLRLTRS